MRAAPIVLLVALLSGCAGTAIVPAVSVDRQTEHSIPGNYVATIQTGNWALRTRSKGAVCGEWSFDADLDGPYEAAMRDALEHTLESVTFAPDILSQEQLRTGGYDAQLVIRQGKATSSFSGSEYILVRTVRSNVALAASVAIRAGNSTHQTSASGSGIGKKDVVLCGAIGDAIGAAAHDAIRRTIEDVLGQVRDGLENRIGAANSSH